MDQLSNATRIDTIPTACLPQKLFSSIENTLVLLPGNAPDSIFLSVEGQHHYVEMQDIIFDVVYCYSGHENVIVVGSEYGQHVYYADTKRMQIKRAIQILREEEQHWNRFVILVTPDEKHIVILTELVFVVTDWSGEIIMDHRIIPTDSFVSLNNGSISFHDESNERDFIYVIPA